MGLEGYEFEYDKKKSRTLDIVIGYMTSVDLFQLENVRNVLLFLFYQLALSFSVFSWQPESLSLFLSLFISSDPLILSCYCFEWMK